MIPGQSRKSTVTIQGDTTVEYESQDYGNKAGVAAALSGKEARDKFMKTSK